LVDLHTANDQKMNTISVADVLIEINKKYEGTTPHYFSIEYWKGDGSLKKISKARRFTKTSSPSDASEKSRFKYNLNTNEAILLYDEVNENHRTCLIYRIHKYNNLKVVH